MAKNGCSFDVTYLWAHDPNKFFPRICKCFLCKMAKNCKNNFMHPKIESFSFHPMETIITPHWGRSPAAGATLHKSEMQQIYTYDFVKKGYFRLLTLFWKYHPLDKHFKHGFNMPHLVIENNAKIWEFGNTKFLVLLY